MSVTATATPTPSPTAPFEENVFDYPPIWPTTVAYTCIFWFFLGLFLWRRQQEPIRSRGWPLVVCSVISTWIFLVIDVIDFDLWDFSLGIILVPCYQDALISGLYLPMWFFPIFYRMYVLYVKFRLNDDGLKATEKDNLNNWVFRNKWTLTNRMFFIMYAFVFLISVAIIFGIVFGEGLYDNGYFFEGIDDCVGDIRIYVGIVGAAVVLCMLAGIYLLWNVRDAFAFKLELILLVAFLLPLFLLWVAVSLGNPLPPDAPTVIWEILMVVVSFIIMVIFPLTLTFNSKYNSAVLSRTSTELSTDFERSSITIREFHEPGTLKFFIDLLEDPVLSEEFKQYCVELWCVENCIFYYAATAYADNPRRSNDERLAEARAIYERFVKMGSPQEINIEASARERVSEILENEAADVPSDIFADAVKRVFYIMKTDTYKKFLQSSRFYSSFLSSPVGLSGGDAAALWLQNKRKNENLSKIAPATFHKLRKGLTKPTGKSLRENMSSETIEMKKSLSSGSAITSPNIEDITEVPLRSDVP